MEDHVLKSALRPGDDCLPLDELGRYADGALSADERARADAHIVSCVNCQAELALMHAVTSSELSPEAPARAARPRWLAFDTFGMVAMAAVLLIAIATGGSYFLFIRRPPVLPGGVTTSDEVTRSRAVTVRGPVGAVREVPQRFEWIAVESARRYRVRLMTVDRQELWSESVATPGVDVPSTVQAAIAPGRTLLWDVTAYDAGESPIAESGAQSFSVASR